MSSVISELRRLADRVAALRIHGKDHIANDELSAISANLHTLAQRMETIMRMLDTDPRDSYQPPMIDPRD